jgi:hypothetical protein
VARGIWTIRARGRRDEPTPPAGPGVGGRVLATLFFAFFLGMGLLFLALLGRELALGVETFGWAERRCEVERSEVRRSGSGDSPYQPEVAFRSVDDGPAVAGRRVQRRAPSYRTYGEAAARLAPYPVGARVACWASPAGEAVLERGPLGLAPWLLLPLVFVAVGAVGIVASWRRRRIDRLGRPMPEAFGARSGRRGARAVMAFGGLFVAAGVAMAWFLALVPLRQVARARGWERHECTVEQSSVLQHESDDATTYSVDILYRWDRGQGIERSSRHSFFGGSSSGYAGKAAIVRAHPPGARVACWVDPGRRNEAVLVRGLTATAWVALLPLAFLGAGVALIAFARHGRGRRQRLRRLALGGGLPFAPGDTILDVLPARALQPGPTTLAPQSTRWSRLAGVVFVTLFWNGIVSVFVHQAWQGWARGRPEWFLILFLVPFGLVGIGLCASIVYALLALRNPRPLLRVGEGAPRLGQRVELHWSFVGAAHRIERVRIVLKGTEQATYQVGTDSRTASESFHEEVLVEAAAPVCRAGGLATFTIPGSSMHSFESDHNQVVWTLEIQGELPRWPDVKEIHPIAVLPRAPEERKREEA